MCGALASVHAMASVAGFSPHDLASARNASSRSRLRRQLTPWKRGLEWRKSVCREGLDVLQQARQIAARKRRKGDQNRAQFRARLDEAEFGIPGPQRIFRLDGGDRMHGMGAPQRVGRDFRKADRADLPCFDESRQFADGVLDRNRFVDAMHIVEVDVIDPEPLPRAVKGLADVGRAVVEVTAAVVAPANGELGRKRDSGAAAFVFGQELADQLLAEPIAIDVGRVPEIDAEIERARQRPHEIRLRSSVRRSRRSSWRRSRRPRPSRCRQTRRRIV